MITGSQGTVTASAKVLFTIPPGPCCVLLSNGGTSSTIWVGAGTGVTTSNGFPVPSGVTPVAFPCYQGNGATPLSAVTSGTATLSWLISSATGGTGL